MREAIEYFDQIRNRCIAAKCVWMINPPDRDHVLATLAEDNAEDSSKLLDEHCTVNNPCKAWQSGATHSKAQHSTD